MKHRLFRILTVTDFGRVTQPDVWGVGHDQGPNLATTITRYYVEESLPARWWRRTQCWVRIAGPYPDQPTAERVCENLLLGLPITAVVKVVGGYVPAEGEDR